MVSAPADPLYHNNTLNKLVAEANVVAVSVDYRLVPEHPLPAAYEDSWTALQWVASHASEDGKGSEKHVSTRKTLSSLPFSLKVFTLKYYRKHY